MDLKIDTYYHHWWIYALMKNQSFSSFFAFLLTNILLTKSATVFAKTTHVNNHTLCVQSYCHQLSGFYFWIPLKKILPVNDMNSDKFLNYWKTFRLLSFKTLKFESVSRFERRSFFLFVHSLVRRLYFSFFKRPKSLVKRNEEVKRFISEFIQKICTISDCSLLKMHSTHK